MSNIVNILREKNVLPLDGTIALIGHYSTNREKKRTYSRKQYSDNPSKKKAAAHAYLALNRDNICAQKRAKNVLAEPKPDVKHM